MSTVVAPITSAGSSKAIEVAATSRFRRGGVPLLACRGICKDFGAVQALSDVDLDVYAGEVVALVGDNGAGKSTLIKAICGIQPADRGTLQFEGETVNIRRATDATRLGIETVHQDLALCDNLDTIGNLFLGRELVGADHASKLLHQLDEPGMKQRTAEQLKALHVTTIQNVRTPAVSLSGGQRQAIAVARATLWDAKLVILDEPTAALGIEQTGIVLKLIERLREQGLGVLVISHNLDVVFEVADRIAVLYVGRNNGTFERATTSREEIVAAIVGIAPHP